jgi:hypothetical protein
MRCRRATTTMRKSLLNVRKLIIALAVAASACGTGGDDGTGGTGGGDPLAKYRQQCGSCPINGPSSGKSVDCCAPKSDGFACAQNFTTPFSGMRCATGEFEVTCWDFDKEMQVSHGCEKRGYQCYQHMYSTNPACCYDTASGWKGETWVGKDGSTCPYADCDGSQTCTQ